MARYTAIADVGSTLLKLLRENMSADLVENPEMIGLCSPAEKNDFKLLLYLYHIEECCELKQGGLTRTLQTPLALHLYYLLAANSNGDVKSKAMDENMILGNAMQILDSNPVLSGSDLEGSLAADNDRISITIVNPDAHSFTSKVKECSELILKNAVCYKIGPVYIDNESAGFAGPRVL